MKVIGAALFFILAAASPVSSQWKQDGKPAADAPDRKELRGFGGHLIVVKDPKAFIQEWLKPETPHINRASVVKRGETLGALVLFAGCKPDAKGVCNTEVDYIIYEPGGGVRAERKEQPLWKEEAPAAPIIQLGRAILAFRLGEGDPVGEYKVKAKVRDSNADVTLDLETTFRLEN